MNSIFHRISVRKYEDKPVEKEKESSVCIKQAWRLREKRKTI